MEAYQEGGYNKYPIQDYLKPFERTAELCRMIYWPPFWVPGVHRMQADLIEKYGLQYRNLLLALSTDFYSEEAIRAVPFMNDLFSITSTQF